MDIWTFLLGCVAGCIMKDEVFEKYFAKLLGAFEDFVFEESMGFNTKCRKVAIKQILEEIENNAYEKAIKDFNDLADGKISIKEAKP